MSFFNAADAVAARAFYISSCFFYSVGSEYCNLTFFFVIDHVIILMKENMDIKYPGIISTANVITAHGIPRAMRIKIRGNTTIIKARPRMHQSQLDVVV